MISFDSSAILALLFDEKGQDVVRAAIGDACISTVNVCEVIGRLVRDGRDASEVLRIIHALPVEIVPFEAADAALAASLLPATRPLGLSLGDRACLALAITRGIGVMTADHPWLDLHPSLGLICIR